MHWKSHSAPHLQNSVGNKRNKLAWPKLEPDQSFNDKIVEHFLESPQNDDITETCLSDSILTSLIECK